MMRGSREDGFILAAVIWFVALLALVTVAIAGWISGSLGQASALEDRVTAQTALVSTTEEIGYLMSTNYFSVRGLEVLSGDALKQAGLPRDVGVNPASDSPFVALDGRPYRFGGGVVELQDKKGLYNLYNVDGFTLSHLLGVLGVPFDERGGLIDKLLDYTGSSQGKRLNGATAKDYEEAGRPPPRGAALITPWELHRVLAWDDYPSLWRGDTPVTAVTTVLPGTRGIDPNTASPAMLLGIPGLDQNAVDRLVSYRATRYIATLAQMDAVAQAVIPLDPLEVSPFPANSLQMTAMFPGDPLTHVVSITQTPAGEAPFTVDYAADLPQTAAEAAALKRRDLPPFPDAFTAP